MLIEEAKWFGEKISMMDAASVFPMCNVGSSTDEFRKRAQPWIDEYIFKPARENNRIVEHLDIKNAPGVDIVGDLSDGHYLEELRRMRFKSIFCSNVLEHVSNREEISKLLTSILPVGGYLFVSCPFKYPFHPDPIDTMFRPNVDELASMFLGTGICWGDVVTGGTYLDYITRAKLANGIVRLFRRSTEPGGGASVLTHIPWLFRNFRATCVVLRKNTEPV